MLLIIAASSCLLAYFVMHFQEKKEINKEVIPKPDSS